MPPTVVVLRDEYDDCSRHPLGERPDVHSNHGVGWVDESEPRDASSPGITAEPFFKCSPIEAFSSRKRRSVSHDRLRRELERDQAPRLRVSCRVVAAGSFHLGIRRISEEQRLGLLRNNPMPHVGKRMVASQVERCLDRLRFVRRGLRERD